MASSASGSFSPPSFSTSNSGGTLTGGETAAGYSFTIPASSGYAPNGDVLQVNDSANGNWTYTYDDFNRLATASGPNQAYSYAYDRYANRWQQNVTSGSGQSSSVTFTGGNNRVDGYSYDADGNLLSDGVHSYTYDAEGQIVSVDGGAIKYVYDANGQRVEKTVGGARVDYIYDLAGRQIAEVNSSGGANREEIYAGGRHLGTYENDLPTPTTFFNDSDFLGSERVETAVNGTACETVITLPFGDGLTTIGSCDPSAKYFTGKERDAESGLDNFGARFYMSNIGRFMSADWSAVPVAVPESNQSADAGNCNLYLDNVIYKMVYRD